MKLEIADVISTVKPLLREQISSDSESESSRRVSLSSRTSTDLSQSDVESVVQSDTVATIQPARSPNLQTTTGTLTTDTTVYMNRSPEKCPWRKSRTG